MTRILVIDGNQVATRTKHVSVGGTDSGDGYAATLKRLDQDIETDIVRPADEVRLLMDLAAVIAAEETFMAVSVARALLAAVNVLVNLSFQTSLNLLTKPLSPKR